MAEAQSDPLIGRTLGPCRIDALLGEGGMGNVYRAHHLRLDRPVAVKVLGAELSGEGFAQALIREARAAAKLEDPRIVQVYDANEDAGTHYVIMQLVEGQTLEARVRQGGPLPQKEALAVMREVLLGLVTAHRQAIVHRDLKPANIMLSKEGQVKIMDFGLAAMWGDRGAGQKVFGLGTPEVLAPEQGLGAPPDPRGDLYAFGATYFFALAGRFPFEDPSPLAVMAMHRETPVPDVRQFNPGVTEEAAGLIKRLLAKMPDQRPATAEEVLQALGNPRMTVDVDATGSPFALKPAPHLESTSFEPPPGFAPETAPSRAPSLVGPASPGAPSPRPSPDCPLPPPPPPVPWAPIDPTGISRWLLLALVAVLFGRHWPALGRADWLGGGLFALAATAVSFIDPRGRGLRKAVGVALFLLMLACFFGPHAAEGKFSGGLPLLLMIAGGLGLATGLAGVYEGLFDRDETDQWLALGLLGASGAVLLGCAALMAAPQASAGAALRVLAGDWGAFVETGGLWRWSAPAVFYAGSWVFFPPERKRKTEVQRVINWNL